MVTLQLRTCDRSATCACSDSQQRIGWRCYSASKTRMLKFHRFGRHASRVVQPGSSQLSPSKSVFWHATNISFPATKSTLLTLSHTVGYRTRLAMHTKRGSRYVSNHHRPLITHHLPVMHVLYVDMLKQALLLPLPPPPAGTLSCFCLVAFSLPLVTMRLYTCIVLFP